MTERRMSGVTPRQVFDVLRDGFSYGDWVVGTRTIRAVDPEWPTKGSRLHYTVGYRPLRKDGHTSVLSYRPDVEIELEAYAWPAGAAHIRITARPVDDGALVQIDEAPSRGPGRLLHNPLTDLLVKARNVETLRRLEARAAGRRG